MSRDRQLVHPRVTGHGELPVGGMVYNVKIFLIGPTPVLGYAGPGFSAFPPGLLVAV